MRKYVSEFIGTFFLVFTIVNVVLGGAPLAPLAIGVVLAAMIFAGGHLSGAHFNPAVTLAVWIRGKIESRDVAGYLIAQVAGAISAGAIAHYVSGTDASSALHLSGGAVGKALVAEALVTFALAYVVLNVATSSAHEGNSFYGLAIGFTVMAGAIAVGGISGGVFNPAVAFGVMTAGMVSWSMLWIYVLANLAGGALAGIAFRLLNPEEYETAAPQAVGGEARVPAPRAAQTSDQAAQV